MEIETNVKNGVTYKNISLNNIALNTTVLMKKIHLEPKEISTKFGTRYVTEVEYKGEKVTMFMTEKQAELFTDCPVGDITVTREVAEYKDSNGKPKFMNKYTFTPANGVSVNIVASKTPDTLSEKQLSVLKGLITSLSNPDDTIVVDGQETTYRKYLGDDVVNNPEKYLV